MPSFCASRAACSGAAPPNAISVRSDVSLPFSTACTRAALAIVSSTISAMPRAASCTGIDRGEPIVAVTACSASVGSSAIFPPAKRVGSIRPSKTSASVTVG
jgi:hypothetical protein